MGIRYLFDFMQWKVGDKCQAKIPNSQFLTTAEIIDIHPESNFCDLRELGTKYEWLAVLDDLICYHLAVNLGVRMCAKLDDRIPNCEPCPNRQVNSDN